MNSTETRYITIPLGGDAHAIAGEFAALQATPQKGKRVYLNTLAVYAVHSYLKWLQIETDLGQSDSWHPSLVTLSNVADLFIPSIGRLECCPVLPGETTFRIPPQAREDRMGCVAVQFSETLEEVQLLGFFPAVVTSGLPELLSLSHLQSMDVFLDYYIPDTASKMPVNLSRWLENIFETGWQTLEELFSTQLANPACSVRSDRLSQTNTDDTTASVRRGKLIDLGIQLAGNPVFLIVEIAPADEEMNIHLQVYPADGHIYLPQNLQLMVLDETGALFPDLLAEARNEDNCLQLEFSGEPGERFSFLLALEGVSITVYFVI